MRTTTIISLVFVIPFLIFSQNVSSLSSKKIITERKQEIKNLRVSDLEKQRNILSPHIKSLQNRQNFPLKNNYDSSPISEEFEVDETKTTIKNFLIENNFLFIERISQVWEGSNWVNNWKYSYTYDDNNNLIELIEQDWDGANWVNSLRGIRSYSPMTTIKYYVNTINAYYLSDNYPNPFNPSTTIEFTLPQPEFVELKVYNILGKEISTLVSKKFNSGNHTYTFDGKNLASGVYYYQLVAGDFKEVMKMILLR